MLIAPQDVIPECVEKIKEEYFYIPAHQTGFHVLVQQWSAGQAIDLITFTQTLRDQNVLETIGGASFVTSLFTFVPTAANIDYYLEIVRDKYVLRQIIVTLHRRRATRLRRTGRSEAALDEVEHNIFKVGDDRFRGQLLTMKEQVMGALEAIEKLWERRGGITGLSTGFIELDRLTSGLHAGRDDCHCRTARAWAKPHSP